VEHRPGFVALLAVTMAAATFAILAFGVLAADLIAEFSLARWQIGALVTASALVGAAASPFLGRWTDLIGARRSTIGTLVVSATALGAVAAAPVFALMVAAALLTGLAQGASNPATNKLIAIHVPPGRQGVITGIKQSGVQIGTFLGGLLLPLGAAAFGWRGAVLVAACVPGVAALVALRLVPADPPLAHDAAGPGAIAIPSSIRGLAVYGFLLGAGGSAIFTYLPLFGREALGLTAATAGATVAVTGFVGIAARIGWSRAAEVSLGSRRALRWIGGLAALAGTLLALAPAVGAWLVWPAAVLTGLSASSWNSVGMLAVIQTVSARLAGRASGVVLLGFLSGLGLGAPIFGWSVDRLESYVPGWLGVTGLFIAGTLVAATRTRSPAAR
jgi:predicted MFS family arabinose efflux permease